MAQFQTFDLYILKITRRRKFQPEPSSEFALETTSASTSKLSPKSSSERGIEN